MPYLMHPEHGFHCATGDEVESMLKNGWVPDTIRFKVEEKPKEQEQPQVKRTYNRKPK